ncbi:ras-related protein RabX-like [Microplitis mediator]|uniref:ras-related protein RabX-like n=1 Tax=Microplitis mediator TaxID=375433 RepID=UPI002553CDFF|nr:ras-related protein RabX-like [Microplitis mediator]
MTMPTQFQMIHPPAQNQMPGPHMHTPPSIFEHMMGQQNPPHEPGAWSQMPQIPPMYMPWSIPSMQQSQMMRFTGEKDSFAPASVHQKRKLDIPDVPDTRPTKQFISEEKMAAHFKNMRISSSYNPTPSCSTSADYSAQPSTSSQVDLNVETNPLNVENGENLHPRLVISEELKRIQQEPLIPASLLSKLERPSMALVLWEPPSKHLRSFIAQAGIQLPSTSRNNEEDNNNNNNNNSNNNNNNNYNNLNLNNNNSQLVANLNESLEPSSLELEPMDL